MTSPTGNIYLDSISWGGWQWVPGGGTLGDPVTLNVYFDDDFTAWTPGEKASYLAAFDAWASVSGITVVEVANEASANFIAHTLSDAQMTNLAGPGVFGFHDTPEDEVGGQIHGYFNYQGYSWPESGWVYDEGGLAVGGWGFYTMMHELGHGLGFAHPHDNGGGSPLMPGVSSSSDYGNFNLNQGAATVMSYNAGLPFLQDPEGNNLADYGYNSGLGAFDIALVQYYYGAETNYNNGNTVYTLPEMGGWMSIWDTGGTDTIRYNGSGDVVINLNSATLDGSEGGAGFASWVQNGGGNSYFGGFTIAADFMNVLNNVGGETGVIIERATGGSGDDALIGNAVGNLLSGRNGDDDLFGLDGRDTLKGGSGKDDLDGGKGNDILLGGSHNDKLIGGSGKDKMKGGTGNDVLNGGAGNSDKMWGNAGRDAFVYRDGYGKDRAMDFEDNIDTLRLDDNLWGGGLTINQMLAAYATDLGDDIRLNFGGGNTLTIFDVADVSMLSNDILII